MSNDYVECPINPERYHSKSMDTLFSSMNGKDIREQRGKYIFDLDFVRKVYRLSAKVYKHLITEFGLRGIKVHTQKNSNIFLNVSEPPYHMILSDKKTQNYKNIVLPNAMQAAFNDLGAEDDTFFNGIIIEQFKELFPSEYNFNDLKLAFDNHSFTVKKIQSENFSAYESKQNDSPKKDGYIADFFKNEGSVTLLRDAGVDTLSDLESIDIFSYFDKHSFHGERRISFDSKVNDLHRQGYDSLSDEFNERCKSDKQTELNGKLKMNSGKTYTVNQNSENDIKGSQDIKNLKESEGNMESSNIFIHRKLKDDDPTILKVFNAKIDREFEKQDAIWLSEITKEVLFKVLSSKRLGEKDKNRIQNKLIELYEDGYECISLDIYEACKRIPSDGFQTKNIKHYNKPSAENNPEIFNIFDDEKIANAFSKLGMVWLSDISVLWLNPIISHTDLTVAQKSFVQKKILNLYERGYRQVQLKVYQLCNTELPFEKEQEKEISNKNRLISQKRSSQKRRKSSLSLDRELSSFLNDELEKQIEEHSDYVFVELIFKKIMTRTDLLKKLPSSNYIGRRDLFTSLLKRASNKYSFKGEHPVIYTYENPTDVRIIQDQFQDKKITSGAVERFGKKIGLNDKENRSFSKVLDKDDIFFEFRPGEFVLTNSLALSEDELKMVENYLNSLFSQGAEYIVLSEIIPNPKKLPKLKNNMLWTDKLLSFYANQIDSYKNLNWEYEKAISKPMTQNNYIICRTIKPWRNLLDLVSFEVKNHYNAPLTKDNINRFLVQKHIYDDNGKLPDYIVKNVFTVDKYGSLHIKDLI